MRKIMFYILLALVVNGCVGKDSNGLLKSPCREAPIQKNNHSLDSEKDYYGG
ncbi:MULTISPECIES: hypothetical protein [Arcobacteraceae]|uniref:hypothetical protein n=1 Tax=Arcobacteraceae TaxID=2808963 RepID=UPI000ABB47E9|nr:MULTISPECIES: hypothetical protein [Arcobacteraceae]MDY0179821.1 hypothetical protein [Aliarcobacter skirrowii]